MSTSLLSPAITRYWLSFFLTKIGCKTQKFHGLKHYVRQREEFGSQLNLYGGVGEKRLSTFVKQPVSRTRKQHSTLVSDLANRHHELILLQKAKRSFSLNNKRWKDIQDMLYAAGVHEPEFLAQANTTAKSALQLLNQSFG